MIKSIDFGFIVSRVMREYRMSHPDVLRLPLRTFWMLNKNIDRLLAEGDLRNVEVILKTQSQEGLTSLLDDLRGQMGRVIDLDEVSKGAVAIADAKLDREGLAVLKGMSG